MKLLLFLLLFISSVYANKVIYFSYDTVPQRVIQGEIFPITLKTLSTIKKFQKVNYTFSNYYGLKVLSKTPQRKKVGKYYFDTFYLLSTKKSAKLPDITARLTQTNNFQKTKISGQKLNVITLNPKKNFSNLIANSFELEEYKTTSFDKTHNIVVFVATAHNTNIRALHFQDVFKQGIESVNNSFHNAKITYFVVIDKRIENFSMSYFNLHDNRYQTITIPIVVDADSVTTQTDLKPKDQSHQRLKMAIAGGFAFIAFLIILIRKKYIYLIILVIPLAYIAFLAIPDKEVCINEGAQIRLLPVENGTIFQTTSYKQTLMKEGEAQNFIKVKLKNDKIGWIRNEDVCSF